MPYMNKIFGVFSLNFNYYDHKVINDVVLKKVHAGHVFLTPCAFMPFISWQAFVKVFLIHFYFSD